MKHSRIGTLIWLAFLLGFISCTRTEEPAEWRGTIRDSAGVRIVDNPAEGVWTPDEEWRVRDVLTIGSDTLGVPYQFGRIRDLAVDSSGSIYVLDAQAAEIRVFDANGVHTHTIGRRGAGPGEFSRAAAAVFLTDDGRLGVPDMGNSRLNWLDPDGTFLGSTPVTYHRGFPVRWDHDGSGDVVVQRRAMGANEDTLLAAGDPLVRIEPDGSETLLVLMPPARTVRMEGARPVFTYFETEPSWDLGPSGTLRTAMTQEYRIALRGRDGEVHTIISKASPRREVTAADRERFMTLLEAAMARTGMSPDAIARYNRTTEFGSTFPAFNRIMEGPHGTTLVQQVQTLQEMTSIDLAEEQSRRLGATAWDVFDASGRFLGEIELPERFTPMGWTEDAVYGRWLDAVDRHHVRKLRLVDASPPRGPA